MKKNLSFTVFGKIVIRKNIFLILSIIFSLQSASAGAPVEQKSDKISINVQSVGIEYFLREIEKQTDYKFLYRDDIIDKKALVTYSCKDANLIEVLNVELPKLGLKYKISDKTILLTKGVKKRAERAIIKGKVIDEFKDPVVGATIIVVGTNTGAIADSDGNFEFVTPVVDSMILEFSFVSMKTATIKYVGQKSLTIVMKESSVEIDDVVITGYANISKHSFTGNARTIKSEDLKKVSPTNVLKSLQVLDPSFRLSLNNEMGSNPNAAPKMSVRGSSGIGITELDEELLSKSNLNSDPNLPTFIMDGFEVSMQKVYDMDINRIESMTLLKDAAATAIYGSRAANGVIVITTRAPKSGEIIVTYNYNLTLQTPDLSDYNLMNAQEKLDAEVIAGLFDNDQSLSAFNEKKLLVEQGIDTDWMSLPIRNTISNKHYLRVEGGSRNMRYGLDISHNGNNGVMKESSRKTTGIGFELQYSLNKLLFKNTAGYSRIKQNESSYGEFSEFTSLNPYLTYKDEFGDINNKINIPGKDQFVKNPMYESTLNSHNRSETEEFYNNFNIQYHLTNKINFKANIAITRGFENTSDYTDPESGEFTNKPFKGELIMGDATITTIDGGVFGYYNDVIKKHNINLVTGINIKESTRESANYFMRDLPIGGFINPQFAKDLTKAPSTFMEISRLFGVMASMNYTYDNIYLFDITGRIDGNSAFGSESRFAPFWSTGFGINIHKYSFMSNVEWVSELKIRGSYGITGKASFPTKTARTVYTIDSDDVYSTGIGSIMQSLGNKNLKWEKTKISDVGINLRLFENKVAFNASYYNRRTVDLIADMYIPASSGFTLYKDNVGEMVNKGIELDLRVQLIGNKNTTLFISGSLAHNNNRIEELSESMKSYNKMIQDNYDDSKKHKPLLLYLEGASTTSIYAMPSLGIDPQTGEEMFRHLDGSASSEWVSSENIVFGNSEPKFNGSFYTNLYHKGFSFDLYFTYRLGGQQYNQTLQSKIENADIFFNADKRVLYDRWQKPGDESQYKSISVNAKSRTNPTSRFVQDDNTLSLSSITFGYDLPDSVLKKIKFNSVRFSLSANDLFQISTIKQERGLSYPFARSVNFSVNVSF